MLSTTISREACNRLQNSLSGHAILPGDPDYETARKVYNGMIDRHPALIVKCRSVDDAAAAIEFGRNNQLPAAIRSGGHSAPGFGVCDDGLVIDLSQLKTIRIDLANKTVQTECGCTWGELDRATHEDGLATVGGVVSTTGVAGLTVGGGHGYLTRKYGLSIDNLISADVLLADCRRVTASADENPDLFWAIRGGGGNFGVVTSFRFRLHPVSSVLAGVTLWPKERAEEVLQWYREFLHGAPAEVYGFFAFLVVPPAPQFPAELHGKSMCGVVWCYTGDPEAGKKALSPATEIGPPALVHIGEMPYPALQSMFDALMPPGLQMYWKGDIFRDLNDAAVRALVEYGTNLPTPLSTVHLYPIDGAVHRLPEDATAFPFRDCRWSAVYAGIDPSPDNAQRITQWARECYGAVHPNSVGATYVNFMMDEGEATVRSTYRGAYERLAQIKKTYDPDNFFRINQNIPPAA